MRLQKIDKALRDIRVRQHVGRDLPGTINEEVNVPCAKPADDLVAASEAHFLKNLKRKGCFSDAPSTRESNDPVLLFGHQCILKDGLQRVAGNVILRNCWQVCEAVADNCKLPKRPRFALWEILCWRPIE